MRAEVKRVFVWMAIFFIAMAFLESAVVVYLRALYYPDGFRFPLIPMDQALVATEMGRELATLMMLFAPAALVTRSALERFAWFCYGFGVWDLFYYVWLKVLLNWPATWADPDLLFLLPVPWVGPVWAPCLVSLGLIILAVLILRGTTVRPLGLVDGWASTWLVIGALALMLSFVIEPWQRGLQLDAVQHTAEPSATRTYVPDYFPWHWFALGCMFAMIGMTRIFRRGCLPP